MSLVKCLENALKDVERTFKKNELNKMTMDEGEIFQECKLVRKDVYARRDEFKDKMFEKIRVYKLFCILSKNIIEMALRYAAMACPDEKKCCKHIYSAISDCGFRNDTPSLEPQKDALSCGMEEDKMSKVGYLARYKYDSSFSQNCWSGTGDKSYDKKFLPVGVSSGSQNQNMLTFSEAYYDGEILDKVLSMLNQGSLENDIRFSELMSKTLKEMEKFDAPEIVRMSVQFVIAKKYVDDIISLKKDVLRHKYFWEGYQRHL